MYGDPAASWGQAGVAPTQPREASQRKATTKAVLPIRDHTPLLMTGFTKEVSIKGGKDGHDLEQEHFRRPELFKCLLLDSA